MKKQTLSQIQKSFGLLAVCSILIFGYNNCTKGFEIKEIAQDAQLPSTGSGDPDGGSGGPAPQPPGPGTDEATMPKTFSNGSLQVCPNGCTFTKPSQAIAVAKNGDVVEIMSGDYEDCIDVRQNNLTVRGVGATRPHMHSVICGDKGIITNYGMQNRYENIEFSQFRNGSQNAAAVRQDASAKDVILSNLVFHDGEFGVLGGSPGDRIFINDSKFYNVGVMRDDGEISVPVFISSGGLLHIRKSSFTAPVGEASLIKVRTSAVTIDCSTIANLESPDSYTVDYQTGGKLVMTNNVLEQSDKTVNSTIVAINSVSYNAGIENSITMKGNLILNDANKGVFVKMFQTVPNPITVTENTFVGEGTLFSNGLTPDVSNKVLASRTPEMGAYPKLPAPGACVTEAPKF